MEADSRTQHVYRAPDAVQDKDATLTCWNGRHLHREVWPTIPIEIGLLVKRQQAAGQCEMALRKRRLGLYRRAGTEQLLI